MSYEKLCMVDDRRVRRGCIDCAHRDVPQLQYPCSQCFQGERRWIHWKDKGPLKRGYAIRQTKPE